MKNAFSVDLEDWFCVYNFSNTIPFEDWDKCDLHVEENINRLLELFSKYGIVCTFFVLGWIAEKCPEVIKTVARAGHEISTHGYAHLIVKDLTPRQFEDDLVKSIKAIKKCVNTEIKGFRAPSFSVSIDKLWIFEILAKHGIKYDSSIFPIGFHPDYASLGSPLSIFNITKDIIEFPLSCFKFAGLTLPCSGGGYFRLFPYWYTSYGIKSCNKNNRPAIIYIHPWEIDVGQPKIKNIPLLKKIRHYINIDKTEERLNRLFSEFEFDTVASVLGL
jgi:polysaccharide deacetylase family protein (PEP-CTERM system associated)